MLGPAMSSSLLSVQSGKKKIAVATTIAIKAE
jgi:hypothetical protein